MNRNHALAALAFACIASGTASAQQPDTAAPSAMTFMDSRLFDNALSKELGANKDIVEVTIAGKMSLNAIPARVDNWISIVGENGEVSLKPNDPALKPKFLINLIPIVFSFIKQSNAERAFDPAKKYNASIFYHVDKNGDALIEKIVFIRKKHD